MSESECPAGGEHTWVTLTAWEAGPGSDRGGTRCDECGARPPDNDGDDVDTGRNNRTVLGVLAFLGTKKLEARVRWEVNA